jgi:hypothetical protein
MNASTNEPSSALFGLPLNLIDLNNGNVPVLVKMTSLGLNRDHKREIAGAFSRHASLAKAGKQLRDIDARVVSYYMRPVDRNVNYWMALDSRGGPLLGAQYSSVRAPDLALLREYDPGLHTRAFDEDALIEVCPVWPRLFERTTPKVKKVMQKTGFRGLMTWLDIRTDLARWAELTEPDRITLVNAVFSMMTITLSEWFISEAIKLCPSLFPYFEPLYALEENTAAGLSAPPSVGETDMNDSAASADDVVESRWTHVLDRVAELAEELRQAPDSDLLAELKTLCAELDLLGPQLGRAERLAEEIYQRNQQAVAEMLAAVSADVAFDWLDADTAGQVEARWTMARLACESPEEVEVLAADCQRAQAHGAEARVAICMNAVTTAALAQEAALIEDQRDTARSLAEKRTLAQQVTMVRSRQSEQDNELMELQERFLSALSPHGERFDLEVDYVGLLAGRGVQSSALVEQTLESCANGRDDETAASTDSCSPYSAEEAVGSDAIPYLAGEAAGVEGDEESVEDVITEIRADVDDPTVLESSPAPVVEQIEAVTDAIVAVVTQLHESAPKADAHPPEGGNDVQVLRSAPAADPNQLTSVDKELFRPIWRMLDEGRISLAYQLSQAAKVAGVAPLAPPSALVACIALADNVVLPEGAVVTMLSQRYHEVLSSPVPVGAGDDWCTAVAVLKAAATLRPLLLAPASGAADMARDLHLDAKHQSVYQMVSMLASHSERLQGFRLELSTFKGTRTEAAWQHDVDALRQEARDWMDQAQHMTMLFSASTKVWLHWLKPGGLIHLLLSPVEQDQFGKLDEMKALIAELGQPGSLEKRVQHTDRREVGRRRGEDIQARALVQIIGRVEEARSLARRWVVLVESRPHMSDALDRKLGALRAAISEMREKVIEELSSPLDRDDFNLVAAARRVLRRSLDGLWDLFDPHRSTQAVEQRPHELLGQDLLLLPEFDQNERWEAELEGRSFIEAVYNSCNIEPLSPRAAFDERLRRQDLEGAERLLTVLERIPSTWHSEQGEISVEDLRENWKQRLEERRLALRRQIESVRSETELGVAYGLITEAERAGFDGKLVEMEASLDSIRRFWAMFGTLAQVSATISARRREKTDAVHARLDELASRGADTEDLAWVRDVAVHGDVLTANELLQRIEHGEQLDRRVLAGQDRFSIYFPHQANMIDEALDALNPTELRAKLRGGIAFADLDFSQIAQPQMRQAEKMVSAWLNVKSRRIADEELLKTLLESLGFDVLSLRIGQQINHRMECELVTTPIEDRAVCPVPYFGSHAGGRYRVVCVWQRPAEEDIIKLVGDSTVQRPTILLYFGRLTERKRRDASRLAKLQHRSFLLIDETLLVSLTAEGGSRLAAVFETALPFAYSAPYDATSSVVPSEMFFGRLQELQAIQGLNGRCFIYGGRQLGKTALLRNAEKTFHSPEQSRYAKWIDLRAEGIGVNREPSEVWLCIARELRRIGLLQSDVPDPNPKIKGRVETFVSVLKDLLEPSSDKRVLLLLDEADRFFEQDRHGDFAETRRLKELMEQTERRFKVVFAGLHNVLRMTENANHPLAHLGEPIKVGPLLEGQEWRDAEDLIRKPFQAAGFDFESRDLVTRVLAQTNYYPSLIQLYCTHLMRHMLGALRNDSRLAGPRYVIQARHVDAVYKNPALRDEIRTKFNLTLQLDPRYEVIAYTLAHGALDGRYSVPEGVLARDVKSQVAYWWSDGFANTSDLEFRVLLDEMVGLGVLRESGQGRYALRNPNVLLLLGSKEEIEDVLVKDREPAQEFDSSIFRARLAQEPNNVRRHPLNFQQQDALTRPANAVTVLSGSCAAGLEDILHFLRATIGEKFLVSLDGATNRADFKQQLERLKDRAENGTTVAVVPADVPWSYAWVADARQRLERLSSKDRHVHVLFLCDPASAWAAIQSGEEMDWPDVNHMQLSPWQDPFLRQWMEDCGLPNDKALRAEVAEVTGLWPNLLYSAFAGRRDGVRVIERLEAVQGHFNDSDHRNDLLSAFGLDLSDVELVLRPMASLGEELPEQELALISEVDVVFVAKVLRWAQTMNLAHRTTDGRWRLDPIAQRLLVSTTER